MKLSARLLLPAVALALVVFTSGGTAHGQCVSLTTLASASTQNFDTLSNTAATTTNSLTITGWYLLESGGGVRDNEQYAVDTGASNSGDTFSYGAAAATDRALGGLQSGTLIPVFGACFTNNTGATVTSLDVAYTGEEWRLGTAARTDQINFEYSTDALDLSTGTWTGVAALNFVTPVTATTGAKDGNAAANRTALSSSIAALAIPNGATFWIRWTDTNATSSDDGLAVDDFSVTPQGGGGGVNLSIDDVSLNEGNAGTTNFAFTVSLSSPAPAGGVTFDIATADGTAEDDNPGSEDNDYVAQSISGQTIAAGDSSFTFTVLVNGDAVVEPNETFLVDVTNVSGTGVIVTDGQGQGTITNDDFAVSFIHDLQGNGAATPIPPATVVQVEGVVTADFQAATQLSGFFLQEEDTDVDADPATSEGIFVFCNTCPTAVAEGQRVQVTGTVGEFFGNTEMTASTAGSVVVTNAGNNLAQVTPATIDLPVVGVVNDFYEPREGMKVTFVDTLTVAEYFELARYGQIELFEGSRPRQFTADNPPSVPGYVAHLAALDTRRVILDDDDNSQNVSLLDANGFQFVYPPVANGGFSVGTQGTDFFRGGDQVNGLTGVLDWSFAGASGTDAWRVRPTAANPATFTVANPRPATPPAVGGAIRAVGMNLLNYFTTIDTTASNSSGPCGPSGTLDCRGADSVAELNRQRERASIVICTLNADVYGFGELENSASASITDLLGAVNTLCGGSHPYAFIDTGGTLGTDAIRVQLIYRTGVLAPVGGPLSDLDAIHDRPPTAQTFDVVDAANPAFGERFTVIANHFKSKGSSAGLPGDADAGDGAGFSNATRTLQASRLLTWISSTVLPAAGDADVLLLGDFNSYAQETPITTLTGGGYTDLETTLLGPAAYSYLFDGQLGHLDYAFASTSLAPQVTGVGAWHINADEASLLDYNDEIKDTGESAFEEKPDGSALVPPRVLFQPATPYRASDHDPVLVGIFPVADLAITKTDGVTTATPGGAVTYTISASNAGPDPDPAVTVADTFAASLTCSWTCVGAGGGTCAAGGAGSINDSANLPVGGSATYTASCTISGSATGSLVNIATVTSAGATSDPNSGNNSATDTDTLTASANVSITKTDGASTEIPGTPVTYTLVASNAGPSAAPSVAIVDNFAGSLSGCSTTCVGSGGGICTAGPVSGNLNDAANLPVGGSVTYTAVCNIAATATGALVNTATATVGGGVTDPTPGDNTATDSDTLTPTADVSITKTDGSLTATPGAPVTYTIVVANAGPSAAPTVGVLDVFAASLSSCATTCVGAGGGSCTAGPVVGNVNETANLPVGGSATYTATCTVSPSATGTLVNTATATVNGGGSDPNTADNSATDTSSLSNELFLDDFESGDTSAWSLAVPFTFETYATLAVAGGSTESAFGYDFSVLRAGEAFAESSIAFATDAAGRPLFVLGARRLDANGPLELTLEVVGGGLSSWVEAAEVEQEVRLEWSAAGESNPGHVAVSLDGRLALWVEGYTASAKPAGVRLLRAPVPAAE